MMNYEMQGLTWQARKNNQQDAILVAGKVIQHKGIYSKAHRFNGNDSWCVAVADGVSSHPYSGRAAKQVLKTIQQYYAEHEQDISFSEIQHQLSDALAMFPLDWDDDRMDDTPVTEGASTTMALLRHSTQDQHNVLRIQSLGDSRVYVFSHLQQQWLPLTQDDNFLNELINTDGLNDAELAAKYDMEEKELASMYYVLTGFFCADGLHEVSEKSTLTYKVQQGDAFLVCTDGVFDALPSEQWQPILASQTLKEWLEVFLKSLRSGAGDNVSLVLVRATEE